jgi:hypothetical protein
VIVPLEKPGTPEELIHFGVRGMKWGVRRSESSGSTGSTGSAPKQGMSTKKKVAIGVGIGVAVVGGAAAAGYVLGGRGKLRISDIDGGKDNIIRLKNGKGALSTLTHEQWNTKISEQRGAFRALSDASRRNKNAGLPGFRPGVALGPTSGSSRMFNPVSSVTPTIMKSRSRTIKVNDLYKE